jgi:hypothetical protein
MGIQLAKIVADIHDGRKTGVLTVIVKGGSHLLKFFFKDGQVYHLTCGNMRDSDCLRNLSTLELGDCLFLPDVKLEVRGDSVPATAELIQQLKTSDIVVDAKLSDGGARSFSKEDSADVKLLENIKMALIRQIGPVGSKVMSRMVAEKWNASPPFSKEDIDALLKLLQNEIDDLESRSAFIKEASKGY